jgi:hypothetical protein
LYRGWNLAWVTGLKATSVSTIDSLDAETLQFKLREPRQMTTGETFEVFPPSANWNIHSNTITGCLKPVVLDSYGSETSLFKDNIVSRGNATEVKQAIAVHGRFQFIGNHISGFDEKDSCALAIFADPLERVRRNVYRHNIFERCANAVAESEKGLWQATSSEGNVFSDCGNAPKSAGAARASHQIAAVLVEAPKRPTLRAVRVTGPVTVDGNVSEWPWTDATRAVALAQTPNGETISGPKGALCAASDNENLYLAVRVPMPKGKAPSAGGAVYHGDGMEVSFQNTDPQAPSLTFILWGSADGKVYPVSASGISPAQADRVEKAVVCAARVGDGEWTCEWRIPFRAVEINPATVKKLLFNLGAHDGATGSWMAWVGTGGPLCQVGMAGDLVLER